MPEADGGKGLLSLGVARDTRFIHFKFEPMVSFSNPWKAIIINVG